MQSAGQQRQWWHFRPETTAAACVSFKVDAVNLSRLIWSVATLCQREMLLRHHWTETLLQQDGAVSLLIVTFCSSFLCVNHIWSLVQGGQKESVSNHWGWHSQSRQTKNLLKFLHNLILVVTECDPCSSASSKDFLLAVPQSIWVLRAWWGLIADPTDAN